MVASGCEVSQWILDLPKERRQRGRRRGGGEAAPPKRNDISTVPKGDRMKARQRRYVQGAVAVFYGLGVIGILTVVLVKDG